MSDCVANVKNYTAEGNEGAMSAIVKFCDIALRNADSALVSATDPTELAAVRDGFAAKKLGLAAEAAAAGIASVVQKMKAAPRKSRVTFYYLLAEATGTLGKLS
jgi:Protein of unknown function (DUF2853)